jgi:small conductance mechanosensitive channel
VNRLTTLQGLSRSIANYTLLFVLIVMLLDAVGANVYGLITTAGIGGIAVGLGAQKLVKDVISGFFLIIEDQFVVGDYVTIGAATGVVQELGMRITRIHDDSGRMWILSNGDISTVTNHSRGETASPIDVSIAASSDAETARRVIQEACGSLYSEQPGGLRSAPKVEGIAGWDTARILIRVSISAAPNVVSAEQIRVRQTIYHALITNGIDLA